MPPSADGAQAARPTRIAPDPELLQAIYQTAVTPENYEELMARWQDRIEAALAGLPAERLNADGDLIDVSEALPHLETSSRILDRLGRTAQDGVSRPRHVQDGLHLLLDAGGRVVWHNPRTARLLGLQAGIGIDRLPLDADARQRLSEALPGLAGSDPMGRQAGGALAFLLHMPDGEPVHMVATRAAEPGLVVLRSAASRWTALLGEMMREAFDLSGAEIDIVALLVEGADLPEIAAARERSLNTVRTQLKAILRKTRTRSQAAVIRLALGLAAHLPELGSGERRRSDVAFIDLPSGRRMPWRRLGPERGRPILFLHGMLDGIAVTDAAHDLLLRHGLQLIAPERPFFGSAPGAPWPPAEMVDRFADDLEALCAHLRLEAPVVLGHMAGAVYAFGLAARHPGRVRAIVTVSGGVPILSPRQFEVMSARQRVVAFTARYAPAALPFILRAGIRQIDAGGEHRFVTALYQNSPRDMAALRRQEVFDIVTDGVRYAVEQGARAFEIDSWHVVRDWSSWVEASTCPVHLLHGRGDPVVAADTVEAFAARLGPRAHLRMIEDGGQLIYHTHPEAIMATLVAALDG